MKKLTAVGKSTAEPASYERVFFHLMTGELRTEFEDHRRNIVVLQALRDELGHRRRKVAKELLVEVNAALNAIFPTTDAPKGRGKLPSVDWPPVSPLKLMGYAVGKKHGVGVFRRQDILKAAFLGPIPNAYGPEDMKRWSAPKTAQRLLQIAENIAASCRNQKRYDPRKYGEAIRDWEHDLAWLKRTFYDGHFRFAWPVTALDR